MPTDLNREDLESLTEKIEALPPGRAMMSSDGLVVRRRHHSIGFDCGVGLGGYASRRANTAEEAARDMLKESAAKQDPASLGGNVSFQQYEKAIEEVRRGEALPSGPSPAVKALRRVAVRAGLHSYRTRAHQARDALAKGDIAGATRQIEAIIEHAGSNGRLKDVERAKDALNAINEHHEQVGGSLPRLTQTKISIRVRNGKHYVVKNGSEVSDGLTRAEAERRQAFLTRKAARDEDVAAIDKEIDDLPDTLRQDDEAPAAA